VRGAAAAQPALGWVLWPLLGLFYVFIYLSWTAGPMFNLVLRFNRFGRHVLSRDQRTASNWFGGTLLAALASAGWWLTRRDDLGFLALIIFAVLSICLAATFAHTARHRLILAAATTALTLLAVTLVVALLREHPAAGDLSSAFAIGFIAVQLLANTLRSK
jgi:hypothetical protein